MPVKSMTTSTILFTFLAALVSVPACNGDGAGGKGQPSGSKQSGGRQGKLEAAKKQAEPVYAALAEIVANFPDVATLKQKKCAAKPKWMGGISWNKLMKITGGEPSAEEKEVWDLAQQADVGRINRLPPHNELGESVSHYTEAATEFAKRTHMSVLRVAAGKSTKTRATGSFEGGFAAGWVVVFDVQTRQPVCQWPVVAESSKNVHYSVKSGDHQSDRERKKKYAVKEDLKRKMRDALNAARREMIPAE